MRKNPSVKDYKGNAYVRRRRYRTKLRDAKSYRCLDCHHHCFLSDMEMRRRARPHCMRCGGPLEQTDATKKKAAREVGGRRAQQALDDRVDRGIAQARRIREQKCWCDNCDQGFETPFALGEHLRECSWCRQKAALVRALAGTAFAVNVYRDALWIERRGGKANVKGLADKNVWVEVERYWTVREAELAIERICGR
jgi:hypothetical protein